jgi:hypothetical protein
VALLWTLDHVIGGGPVDGTATIVVGAPAQLAYPLAELMVKIAIALGAHALPPVDVGTMSGTSWFNRAAAWAVCSASLVRCSR